MPILSVIIPVFNDAANLDACLSALDSSTVRPEVMEVIVVDDGSRAEAAEAAAEVTARHGGRFARLSRNAGPAAARNEGARLAAGGVFFFLDSDVLVEPDTLARVIAAFERDASLAALFGSYQADTIPDNFISRYKNLLHHYTHQISSPEASTFCGGFGAVRRDVFEAMRGFDEAHRALEDVEFGYRMHFAGHRIRLDRDLHFTHLKRYTLWSLMRSDLLYRAIPWTRMMRQKRVFRNDLNTRSSQIASVAVALLIAAAALAAAATIAAAIAAAVIASVAPLPSPSPRPGAPGALVLLLPLLLLTSALIATYAALNWHFLAYVQRLRGTSFAVRTLVMHWWFHVYSAAGLVIGLATPAPTPPPAPKPEPRVPDADRRTS
jgi:GT2 family glycosyltransferase